MSATNNTPSGPFATAHAMSVAFRCKGVVVERFNPKLGGVTSTKSYGEGAVSMDRGGSDIRIVTRSAELTMPTAGRIKRA
jgi:hypothetical protein